MKELYDYLKAQGVMTGVHYPVPVHLQSAFQYLGYRQGDLPEAERAADSVLSLPMFPELEPGDIDRITQGINSFFKNPRRVHV